MHNGRTATKIYSQILPWFTLNMHTVRNKLQTFCNTQYSLSQYPAYADETNEVLLTIF